MVKLENIGKKVISIRKPWLLYNLLGAVILKIITILFCIYILSNVSGSYSRTMLVDMILDDNNHTLTLLVHKEFLPVVDMLTEGQKLNIRFTDISDKTITAKIIKKINNQIQLELINHIPPIAKYEYRQTINISFIYNKNNIIKRCVNKMLNRKELL